MSHQFNGFSWMDLLGFSKIRQVIGLWFPVRVWFLLGGWTLLGGVSYSQELSPLILTGPIPTVTNDEERIEFPLNVQADNQLAAILAQIAKLSESVPSDSAVSSEVSTEPPSDTSPLSGGTGSENTDGWRDVFIKLQTLAITEGDTLVPANLAQIWPTNASPNTEKTLSISALDASQRFEMTYVPLRRKIRNILLRLPKLAQERFQRRYEPVVAERFERILDDYRAMKRMISNVAPGSYLPPSSVLSEDTRFDLTQSFEYTAIERRLREISEYYPLGPTSLRSAIMAGELAWQRGDTLAARRDWSDAIVTWEAISDMTAEQPSSNQPPTQSDQNGTTSGESVQNETTLAPSLHSTMWLRTDWGQELRIRLMWLSVAEHNRERLARELAAFEVRYPQFTTTSDTSDASISLPIGRLRKILEKVHPQDSDGFGVESASTISTSSRFQVSPFFSWQSLVHPADPLLSTGQILPVSADTSTDSSHGTIWFADSQSVYAVDRETGEPLWGNETPRVYQDTEMAALFTAWDRQLAAKQVQTSQNSDVLAQLPTTSYHPSEAAPIGQPIQMVTIIRNRLLVRLGSHITRLSPINSTSATTSPTSPLSQTTQNVLVSLDLAAEGRLDWRISPPSGMTFAGIPIADTQRVYCALRRDISQKTDPTGEISSLPDTEANAALLPTQSQGVRLDIAAFDINTGALLWQRPLLQTVQAAQRPEITYTWLTLDNTTRSGSTLFVNTQLGAVVTLDRVTGIPFGISTYPRHSFHETQQRLTSSTSRNLAPVRLNSGILWTAPQDSERIFAWDAATGRPIAASVPLEEMDSLLDIEDTQGWGMGMTFYRFTTEGAHVGQAEELNPIGEAPWNASSQWNFHNVPPVGSGMGLGCRVFHNGSYEIWLPVTYAATSNHFATPAVLRYSVQGQFLGTIPLPQDFNSSQDFQHHQSCLLFQDCDHRVLAVGPTGIWNIHWDLTDS